MNQPHEHEDWRGIAAEASKEMDPAKLTQLVAQLCDSFDERDKSRKEQQVSPAA